MWLVGNNLKDQNNIFNKYGKALFIAQKFEITCKDIIKWLISANVLFEGKVEFMSKEYVSYCDKLSNLMLANSINSIDNLKARFNIKKDQIIKLNDAKISRNWIAHESCIDNIIANVNSKIAKYEIPSEFTNHLINIIKGDYMVSRWSFEFHEKESGGFLSEENYLKTIINWFEL